MRSAPPAGGVAVLQTKDALSWKVAVFVVHGAVKKKHGVFSATSSKNLNNLNCFLHTSKCSAHAYNLLHLAPTGRTSLYFELVFTH